MSPLRQRFIEDMQIRNMAPRTIQTYTAHLVEFVAFCGKSPEHLGPEDIRRYQVHLVHDRDLGWSSFNQRVCALKFFYRITLPQTWNVDMIPFGKRPKTLPVVLGPEEVSRLFACVPAHKPKLKMILTTLYATGGRITETLRLTPQDIDSARMLVHFRSGKGQKDRQVPLSPRLLTELREYYRHEQPGPILFPGQHPPQVIDSGTVQKGCRDAAEAAGITKHVTPHVLRHSYATGMLEAGVDLLAIQHLLGHSSLSTTLMYLHCRRLHVDSLASPLDWLPIEQCPRVISPGTGSPTPGPQPPQSPTPRTE